MRRDQQALTRLIRRSVEIKAEVVSADEREARNARDSERGTHRGPRAGAGLPAIGLPHGEAVALGLVAECELAGALGLAPTGMRERVAGLLRRLGLPVGWTTRGQPTRADRRDGQRQEEPRRIRYTSRSRRDLGACRGANGWTVAVRRKQYPAALEAVAETPAIGTVSNCDAMLALLTPRDFSTPVMHKSG